jgi:putative lysine/arginine/ornithine/histidine/octopine transport system permease protein
MIDLAGFGQQLLLGAVMTVQLALAALAVGLGLIDAVGRLSSFAPARALAATYTTVVRGLPELLVVLIIYFGASRLLTAIAAALGHDGFVELSPFAAGVLALGLTFGAYAPRSSAARSSPSPRARSRRRTPSAWAAGSAFAASFCRRSGASPCRA